MNDKPRIRHCKNCKYYDFNQRNYDCSVRYKDIVCERLRAIFCRFYKERS